MVASNCTKQVAEEVMDGIAEGKSLSKVCRDLDLNYNTVYSWINETEKDKLFKNSSRAYKAGYDRIADDCIDIADDGSNDVIDDDGVKRTNTEVIQRSRVRIDTRIRLLGKWSKKYSEKTILAGDSDNPIAITAVTRTIIPAKKSK